MNFIKIENEYFQKEKDNNKYTIIIDDIYGFNYYEAEINNKMIAICCLNDYMPYIRKIYKYFFIFYIGYCYIYSFDFSELIKNMII